MAFLPEGAGHQKHQRKTTVWVGSERRRPVVVVVQVDKADAAGKIFGTMQCKDRWGRPVLLFRNEWKISQVRGWGMPVALA